jgi:hypothetical protein
MSRTNARLLNDRELDAVSGGRNIIPIPLHSDPLAKTVGAGDTIDTNPWGDGTVFSPTALPGSWGTMNNSLPGGGPWGN